MTIHLYQRTKMTKHVMIGLLTIILLLGTVLRFTNLNWDSFLAFHPDERNIAWAVTRIRFFDQLNPRFFAYGGLPIYIYRALGELVSWLTHNTNWVFEWGRIIVLGRYVSATLSSVSIALIYLVGTRYFSPPVGLLSAFLLSFSPWAIREAHFATTETMLVFFLLLLLFWARQTVTEKIPARIRSHRIYPMAIITGFAIGAKPTSLMFLVIPAAAIWLRLMDRSQTMHRSGMHIVKECVAATVFFASAALITALFVSPYTLFDYQGFLESMRYETGVALGTLSVPYTLQFARTTPYLYQLVTMTWQAGPVAILGLLGLIGLSSSMFHTLLNLREQARRVKSKTSNMLSFFTFDCSARPASAFLFLIFPLLYFLWSGAWYAKFARYNVPFLPFVTIAAAWLMIFLFQKFSKKKFHLYICIFVYLLIGVSHALWGLANWTIYLRPQTRILASEWIYLNVNPQQLIYTEHWNDGLPVTLPGSTSIPYQRELLTVYEPDTEEKLQYYRMKLPAASYIILSTRRIWATMPTLTNKYPLTSLFYETLLNGQLGYKEVATFSSYPSLFGITVNDDRAEESIQVFDHPTVRIFKNEERLTTEEIVKKLNTQ